MNQKNAQEELINNLHDGFSSDSQVILEQQPEDIEIVNDIGNEIKEEIRQKLDEAQQVTKKNYSLQPDIQTGWSLKKQLPKPIPLLFENKFVDTLVQKAQKKQSFKSRLIYLGPRFDTTLLAWHNKQFTSPYPHINIPYFPKYSRRDFCGQKKGVPLDTVIFNSHFQSGNLDAAFRINSNHYQLFLRVDSNTQGHIQWFNFTIQNMKKQNNYKFSICNLTKAHTLYNRGCKPYFYSKKKHIIEGVGWHQAGQNVTYIQKSSLTAKIYQQQSHHFMLSFDYETQYEDDEIQICYSIPYTYSRLTSFIQKMVQTQKKKYLQITKLCNSLGALELPLIIVDNTDQREVNKKCIIISGRAHPGESNGSYMMQGFIEFLCGNTNLAQYLRKNIIFKIVPMLNPDGVAIGNHRTGLSGKDFNRNFNNPNKNISPQVFYLKKLVMETKQQFGENVLMFLDFHGHSVKKNVFMYGPQFQISNKYFYQSRKFPKILSEFTKLFRYYSCIFRISQAKNSTARVVMMKKLLIPCSYTIEASNGSYYNYEQLKDEPFNEYSWAEMGLKIGESLQKYCENLIQKQKLWLQKQNNKLAVNYPSIKRSMNKKSHKTSSETHSKRKQQKHKNEKDQFNIEQLIHDDQQIKGIKQLEIHRNDNIISDDQISESSSDLEGEQEDLKYEKIVELQMLIQQKSNNIEDFNSKQVQIFLIGNKEPQKKRDPIWARQFKQVKHKSRYISGPNTKKLIYQSQTPRNDSNQRSFESYQIKREKSKTARVVSFGTGLINFQSSCLDRKQSQADRLYENILNKKNTTFYQKTGFLPSKKKQINQKANQRKIRVNASMSIQKQAIQKNQRVLNPKNSQFDERNRIMTKFKEKQMAIVMQNQKKNYHETFIQSRSSNFMMPFHKQKK